MVANAVKLSPGRRQYLEIKRQHPDALLLVRMGDFYEAFDEDAHTMARALDIVLTSREVGGGVRAPLAGIPAHALDNYLGRLIDTGLRVAICEQTSDPAASRGLVDRAIVRIITPGTVLNPELLADGRNNYLAAVVVSHGAAGLAFVDMSTSEFVTGELSVAAVSEELSRIGPSEILVNESASNVLAGLLSDLPVRQLDRTQLDPELAEQDLLCHFGTTTLEPFGCVGKPLAVMAASCVLNYLKETQLGTLPQITTLRQLDETSHMTLDRSARRDLELFEPMNGSVGSSPTLLSCIDRTCTPMGSRSIRAWLAAPLLDLRAILARQECVESFYSDASRRVDIRDLVSGVPDIERLMNRIRAGTAGPRDLIVLGQGVGRIPKIVTALPAGLSRYVATENGVSNRTGHVDDPKLNNCEEVVHLIEEAISEDAPALLGDGRSIRQGFDAELDTVRSLAHEARSHIALIEEDARAKSGIKSLKVGYNRVFGYYIEISKANLDRVPEGFDRRQTLVNAERFVTPELKELEAKILAAQDRIGDLENAIFARICAQISAYGEQVMASAAAIGQIDVFASLAETAAIGNYTRPELDDGDTIEITAGRHPTVEFALGSGKFVPNDTLLSKSEQQLLIITGPNMSGKSTYIRQIALIVLLAQIGAFVPAERAVVGMVDRIFTRSGLSDDIAGGRSTFMTEMVETAFILNQATPRSLVILDEIGRGTSAYDGLAIARAVAEHIHNSLGLGCRTLFATHYHEMTQLSGHLPRARNYRVAVSEEGEQVTFLHRIVPGGADRSYGVHVGRLAGLPTQVVARAWQILEQLESHSDGERHIGIKGIQLPLNMAHSVGDEELANLPVDEMTPIEAINVLHALKQKASKVENA